MVQEQRLALVKFSGELFHVLNSAQPYGNEPERAAQTIPELRRRKAWADHKAWISIDYCGTDALSPEVRKQKLSIAGRFVAELLNSNCTAVFFPMNNYLVPNDESLGDRLRTFDTLEELYSSDAAPVPVIERDDPRLARVVAEARSRWPEFVEAFLNRTPGDQFHVKALFTDGANGEWMWIEVGSIQGEYLIGSLQNSPVQVRHPARGDEVRVREIGDWCFSRDGNNYGGFGWTLTE